MSNVEIWDQVLEIDNLISTFPGGSVQGDECSIPDVYGRAIQFCLGLKKAYTNVVSTEEVDVWRGLITLLALQDYYNFPIEWEEVNLQEDGNVFGESLKLVPSDFSIFSQPDRKWDGTVFYVLKWVKNNEISHDICLYSPATLLYPIADWRKEFPEFLDIEWFDQKGSFKAPEQVLLESDKKIVAFWLENMIRTIQPMVDPQGSNQMALMILGHCNQYLADLRVALTKKDRLSLKPKSLSEDPKKKSVLGGLINSVEVTLHFDQDVSAKKLFSDQVCCFYNLEKNPFHLCSYKNNYIVKGKDGDEPLYAFLPLNPEMRKYCSRFGLAEGISMSQIKKGEDVYIRVRVSLFDEIGMDMMKDYRLIEEGEAQKNEAFFYAGGRTAQNGSNQLPLIAIWPNTICDIWKRYYIMIEDNYRYGSLEVADVELERQSKYVVKTKYVPDVIPIVLSRDGKKISIGIITLPMTVTGTKAQANISAEVAVDFGTSSIRVFAKASSAEKKREIFITDDSPLVVFSCGNKQTIMRDYFIAPTYAPAKEPSAKENYKKVFSIYKRNDYMLGEKIEPIVDGIIYQAQADERLEDNSGAPHLSRLITNLKWGDMTKRVYYKAFLKQLCLHAISDLYEKYHVNKITWRYALPEIMSQESKDVIREVWQNDIKEYLENMTNTALIKCDVAQSFETESEATSRYFLYDAPGNANAEQGYLVVDIGGGSTDLALWQGTDGNREMKWHDSVNVAGRSMFTRWVAVYLKDFERVIYDSTGTFANMVRDVNSVQSQNEINGTRNALVDRILNFYGESMRTVYKEKCDGGEPGEWPLELRTEIIKGVTLLMFALGCQIGKLANAGTLTVLDQPGTFVVAVAGQGSQILKWTEFAINNESVSKKFFELGRKAVKGFKSSRVSVAVKLSDDPKEEVARGLLEDLGRRQEGKPEENPKIMDQFAQEQEYMDLFAKFINEYRKVFGDKYLLPIITTADMTDALHRYTGDGRSSLVRVFMEVFYMKLLAQTQAEDN